MEEQYAQTYKDLAAEVFFGAGEGEVLEGGSVSASGIVSSMTRIAEILRLRPIRRSNCIQIFPGEDHGSSIH